MHRELKTLIDNDFVKVNYFDAKSSDVVISFSSTPRVDQEEEIAIEQFIGTLSKQDITGIFIVDKQSSYGNKINFSEIAAAIAPIIIKADRVHAIGYCMGGFLAILMSKVINLSSVVAITPQWSIHPDVLPSDSYLNRFTREINDWVYPTLEGKFAENTNYYIFNSDDPDDQHQIKYFPNDLDNIYIYEFGPAFGHDLPESLDGKLEELMLSCIFEGGQKVYDFIKDYYEELGQSIL
jgi:hypothetical protein